MSEAIVKGRAGDRTAPLGARAEGLLDLAKGFAAGAKAASTRRLYRQQWERFAVWCGGHGLEVLPAAPATVALYVSDLATAGRRVAGIELAVVAVSQAHKAAGHASPGSSAPVREVLKGIRRAVGVAPSQKVPICLEELRAMLVALPDNLAGRRDRALLLVGFAGAFRRSELASLDHSDLSFTPDGLEVILRRSKTDQEAAGRKIGIPYGSTPATCPVRVLRGWLHAAGIGGGPVFREVTRHGGVGTGALSGRAVALVVKRAARLVGLDPVRYSGHSLRAGLATAAARAGKSERSIMAQTGHRSERMVRRYIRDASLFTDNAAAGLL